MDHVESMVLLLGESEGGRCSLSGIKPKPIAVKNKVFEANGQIYLPFCRFTDRIQGGGRGDGPEKPLPLHTDGLPADICCFGRSH